MSVNPVPLMLSDAKVILSDFYREKAWAVWIKNKDHGVKCEEDVLKMLRAIADSGTVDEFAKIPLVLKQQPDWQTNEKLRTWFFNRWLCQAEVCSHCCSKAQCTLLKVEGGA